MSCVCTQTHLASHRGPKKWPWTLAFEPRAHGRSPPNQDKDPSLETPETWASNPQSDSCDWAPPDLGFCRMALVFLQGGDCGHAPPSRRPKPAPRTPGRTAATGHLRTWVFVGQLRLGTSGLGFLPDGSSVFTRGRLWP